MVSSSNSWDFLTLLPESNNVDMYKDVGMIPYTLSRDFGLHTAVASSNMDENAASQLDMENTRMDIIKLKKCNRFIAGLLFLLKNAGRIKALNLYHGGKVVVIWATVYKLLNPGGKVYLKLDMNYMYCDKLDSDATFNKWFQICMEKADLISSESKAIQERIQKHSDKEIHIIYNGYYDLGLGFSGNNQKINEFLTVGRLGTREKATDTLLEAFAKSSPFHDWSLKLIGSIEDDFKKYIEEYFVRYPQLINRVTFAGAVMDKEVLYNEYNKAKVFVLPSRWEGFPLVMPEALSGGCKVIGTKMIPPMAELSNGGKYGCAVDVDDVDALANAMLDMTRDEKMDEDSYKISRYAKDNFSWNVISRKLYELIY